MVRKFNLLSLASLFLITGCRTGGQSDLENVFEPNSSSDPVHFEREFFKPNKLTFERNLSKLPTSASVETAWSDTFLPNRWAGGAVRWYKDKNLGDMDDPTPRPDMWKYKLNTLEDLKKLSLESLKSLSPAEKFDLLMSRYDYPLTNVERKRTHHENEYWEGTCNGWSTAALKFSEPPPVAIANKEGIVIPFGSSDIKSLLMLQQYFIKTYKNYAILGDRCNEVATPEMKKFFPEVLTEDSLDACSDSNAGAFHLVVTNMLGRAKKGLVFDVDRDSEVWNQPVFKFSSTITNRTATSAMVSTKIWYAEEEMPHWEPLTIAEKNLEVVATYNYELELNSRGEIIGGKWKTGQAMDSKMYPTYHPDFIWYADGEDSNYKMDKFEDVNKKPFSVKPPVDFGAIVDLWSVATGKQPNFRGLEKMPINP